MNRGHEYPALFITFEGIDFSGKSTQLELLSNYMKENNFPHEISREPGGTDIGEQARGVLLNKYNTQMFPEAEAYFFGASRSQLVRELIIPNLKNGIHVLVDRFVDSSVAYQGAGRKLGIKNIMRLNKMAVNGIMPDITYFIDITVDESLRRKALKKKTSLDRIELSEREFYERVRKGYFSIAKNEPRIKLIDGMKSIEEIHEEVIRYVKKYLRN